MDTSIRRHLGEERGKVVVIHDVDLIPAQAAILLHGFADDQFAPFKDAFFFLTIHRQDYSATAFSNEADLKDAEKRVTRDLTETWSRGLGVDATTALINRVGKSVVIVAPEVGGGGGDC